MRLLDGAFLEAQRRDVDYLLHLDPDRLLHTFRLNAGLPSAAEPLGGWEAPGVELRGHTLGHCLTACALMFEATGDERLARRALAVTAEVARRQQARGSSMYGGPRPGERRGSIPVQGHGRPGLPELAPRPLAGGARAHLLTMI